MGEKRPYELLRYGVKANFSALSIAELIRAIEGFEKSLPEVADKVGGILARRGVKEAKQNLMDSDAIDTMELYNSIKWEHNSKNPSVWTVYTDCKHARFVEFGTGLVGANSPHYSGEGLYFRTTPWTYYAGDKAYVSPDGSTEMVKQFVTTSGMEARPFMYMTANDLNNPETIDDAVKEALKK